MALAPVIKALAPVPAKKAFGTGSYKIALAPAFAKKAFSPAPAKKALAPNPTKKAFPPALVKKYLPPAPAKKGLASDRLHWFHPNAYTHRRRINTEEKAKVVDELECRTKPFCSKDDLKKSFGENIHFGRLPGWWFCAVIRHFFKASI